MYLSRTVCCDYVILLYTLNTLQGFVSIGEVDTRGKIRKIPVRADIKRALCFPGGSTLMVTHLKKELSILQTWEKPLTSPLQTVVPDSKSTLLIMQHFSFSNLKYAFSGACHE
jgi:hypothetical protein